MIEKAIEIRTADGTCDGFSYQPEASGRWPGVIFLTDIFGIRPANQGMAKRLSAEGYTVLLPNIFYRITKPPRLISLQISAKSDHEAVERTQGIREASDRKVDPLASCENATPTRRQMIVLRSWFTYDGCFCRASKR